MSQAPAQSIINAGNALSNTLHLQLAHRIRASLVSVHTSISMLETAIATSATQSSREVLTLSTVLSATIAQRIITESGIPRNVEGIERFMLLVREA